MVGRVIGWILGVAMILVFGSSLALARSMTRTASGVADAEEDLALLADHVAKAYARDHRLCRSSRLSRGHPLSWSRSSARYDNEPAPDEVAEKRENVGFFCLGLDPSSLHSSKNMYTYEASGDRFVLRAFRAYLYDPDGVLPRYERRGDVRSGRLVLESSLHEVAPGGKIFAGHPDGPQPFE